LTRPPNTKTVTIRLLGARLYARLALTRGTGRIAGQKKVETEVPTIENLTICLEVDLQSELTEPTLVIRPSRTPGSNTALGSDDGAGAGGVIVIRFLKV
jgi:hypothetical protein